nr:MAG TPA: hypothetical protein [Caudoviricetes sp.]
MLQSLFYYHHNIKKNPVTVKLPGFSILCDLIRL